MDWLDEFIGFIIVIFIFLFPVLRAVLLKKKAKNQPPPSRPVYEEEPEYEEEEEVYQEPPPVIIKKAPEEPAVRRTVKKDYEFHTDIEFREISSDITERHLEYEVGSEFKQRIVSQAFVLEKKKQTGVKINPIENLSLRYSPLQSMIIFTQVLDRPKWRDTQEHEY